MTWTIARSFWPPGALTAGCRRRALPCNFRRQRRPSAPSIHQYYEYCSEVPSSIRWRAISFRWPPFPAARHKPSKQTQLRCSSSAAAREQPSTTAFLRELSIADFALVERQTIHLGPGFNAITGESGAGKSVLVAAVGQVLGDAATEEMVRPPAHKAAVEGTFSVGGHHVGFVSELLTEAGLPRGAMPQGDGPLDVTVRREISVTEGRRVRSRCLINGAAVPLKVLRQLGETLADVNGQGISAALRDPDVQLELLDGVAGAAPAARDLAEEWGRLQKLRAQLGRLEALSDEETREAMQRLVEQVAEAGIVPGEEKDLRAALRLMDERRANVERCSMISSVIEGSEGDGLTTALREINGWLMENRRQEAGALPEEGSGTEVEEGSGRGLELVDAAMEGVAEAEEGLREALRAVDQYARSFDFDQEAYERTAARSAAVSRLLAVHGCRTSEELLRRAEEARRELEEFRELEAGGGEAGAEEGRLRRSVAEAAVALSCVRRAAAARLGEAVEEALGGLGMSGARFEARVAWEPAAAPSFSTLGVVEEGLEAAGEGRPGDEEGSALEGSGGPCREFRASSKGSLDRVEYLFAAGPQEPLRPLSAVASGGETARVMLALKAAVALQGGYSYGDSGASCSSPSSSSASSSSSEALPPSAAASVCPVLVLDEMDSGVGLRLGAEVGRLLARMSGPGSAVSQVLCITHLPQVAAHAGLHLRVSKESSADDGRVVTRVEELREEEARVAEVAAMMGTGNDTAAAEEILRAAQDVALLGGPASPGPASPRAAEEEEEEEGQQQQQGKPRLFRIPP